jgi:ABC-type transport system involved in cytochrome bd biosynthesis fused ATPase/permease subunit
MTRKELPVLIMLLAGAIASIMTAVMHYEIQSLLFIVFITLVIFYFLGTILKIVLDRIEEQNTKLALDEGEVI